MADTNLVVAVRLRDIEEADQPDPLCVPVQDLSTWRHFETLLKSMYKRPPSGIRVMYLDDENDWIEVSSDAELAEAVKICRKSGEIMQLQVKAVAETPVYYESTVTPNKIPLVPHAPLEGVEVLQPLVYPHPQMTPVSNPPDPPPRHDCSVLVYPHPQEVKDNSNVMAIDSSGNSLSIDGESGLSMEEKITILREQISVCTPPKPQTPQTSIKCLWKEAEKLESEEKLKFMKSMMESSLDKGRKPQMKRLSVSRDEKEYLSFDDVPPPLCVEPGTLGENAPVPKQDPFELESDAHAIQLDPNLGAAIMMPRLLTPERVHPVKGKPEVTSEPVPPKTVKEGEASLGAMSYRAINQAKVKAGKKVDGVAPVPMPRNLMMMDGAQSGANAVTVEMPETELYRSCCVKEEESAASGGASSTSESAETGEVTARGTYGGAAVSREVKSHSPGSCAMAVISPDTDSQRSSSPEKKPSRREAAKTKSSTRIKSVDKVLEMASKKLSPYGVGAKPKTVEKKTEGERKKKTDDSVKRRSSAEKSEKEPGSRKREEKKVKVTEDVESGEKAPVEDKGTKPLPLQYLDFVKYMRKVKREMHNNIVKDVTKQTDRLLQKNYSRAVSVDSAGDGNHPGIRKNSNVVHEGIVCDNCNRRDIVGIRYKCGNCSDYDLCEDCENLGGLHDKTHVFLKIRIPQKRAGRLGKTRVPLLRENIYQADRLLEMKRQYKQQQKALLARGPKSSDEEVAEAKKQKAIQEVSREGSEVDSGVMILPMAQGLELGGLGGEEREERRIGFQGYPLAAVYKVEELRAREEKSEVMTQEQAVRTETESQALIDGAVVSSPNTDMDSEVQILDTDDTFAKNEEIKEDEVQEEEEAEEEARAQEAVEREDEEEDEDGISQAEVPDVDTDEDYDNLDHSSFAEPFDSDTSDDFCVIDPPSREEYEILIGNTEEDYPEVMPTRNQVDEVVTAPSQPIQSDGESSSSIERLEIPDTMSEDEAEEESPKDVKAEEENKDEPAVLSVNEEDLVHPMSDAEKIMYLELLKAELAEQKNVEMLARRAQDLQESLRQKESKEEDVEKILRAKEAEAERENQKLEEARQREKEECRRREEDERRMREEKEELKRREEAERKEREEDKKRKEEEAKRRKEVEEKEMEEKVMKMVSEFKMEEEAAPSVASAVSKATDGRPHSAGLLSRGNSVGSQADSMQSDASEKKDADSQTSPEAQVQASLLIQNVASGMSKAASTAYSTAKDVFYSLQARQKDWKAPHSTWKPPSSTWTPPADNWIPPKNTYVPPTSKWTPPPDMYLMPLSEPEEPAGSEAASEEDTQKKEVEKTSDVDGDNGLTEEKVSELTREREAMARLMEMGFANREKNQELLRQLDYDLNQVIQHLLQLESGDWDWASRRH